MLMAHNCVLCHFLSICAILCFHFVQLSHGLMHSEIFAVTSSNIDGVLADNKYVLVEFCSPSETFCTKFQPEYATVADTLLGAGKVLPARIDCSVDTKLQEKYQVMGLPRLKLFRNKTPIDYTGSLTAPEIVRWVGKKIRPTLQNIPNVEAAETFKATNDVVVIGFFRDSQNENAKIYEKAAAQIGNIDFGITVALDVFKKFGVKDDTDTLIMFKTFDEPQELFTDHVDERFGDIQKFSDSDVKFWLRKFSTRKVTTYKPGESLVVGDVKQFCLLFDSSSSPDHEKVLKEFTKTSEHFRGVVGFVHVDADDEASDTVLRFYGVQKDQLPDMRFLNFDGGFSKLVKYKSDLLPGDYKQQQMGSFIRRCADGDVKPYYKSQKVPTDWDKQSVKVVVRDNFKKVAYDKKKSVLINFYSPWCSHCSELEPIWEKVAEHYKDAKNVVIAKMDATANEIKGVKITGYPTIKLFEAGTNEVVDYTGERSFADLVKFMDKHLANIIKDPVPPTKEEL